jgi:hypothetical protein
VSRFEVFGHQLDLSQWLISRSALCSAFHSAQEHKPHCSESVLPPIARFRSELIGFLISVRVAQFCHLGTDTILLQVAPAPVCLSCTGAKATAVFIPAAQAKLLFAASPNDSVAPRSDFSSVVESLECDCSCCWLQFALLFGLSDCCELL